MKDETASSAVRLGSLDRVIELTQMITGWQSAAVRDGEIADLLIDARLDVHELYEAAAEPSA